MAEYKFVGDRRYVPRGEGGTQELIVKGTPEYEKWEKFFYPKGRAIDTWEAKILREQRAADIAARELREKAQREGERQRRETSRREIEQQRARDVTNLKREYQKGLRGLSLQDRQERYKKFQQDKAQINLYAKSQLVEKGVIVGAVRYGYEITPEVAKGYSKIHTGRQAELTTREIEALTRAGMVKKIIPTDTTLRLTPEQEKHFEKEALSQKIITQKYLDERKTIYDLKTGVARLETYEEYKGRISPYGETPIRKAFQYFGKYVYTPIVEKTELGRGMEKTLMERIPPKAKKIIAEHGLPLLDITLKSALFAPYFKVGAARKKARVKQKIVYRRHFRDLADEPIDVATREKLFRYTEKLRKLSRKGKYKELADELVGTARKINAMEGIERDIAIRNFRQYLINLKAEGVIPPTTQAAQQVTGMIEVHIDGLPIMKNIDKFVIASKLIPKQPTILKPIEAPIIKIKEIPTIKTTQKLVMGLKLKEKLVTILKQQELLRQPTKQISIVKQLQKPRQRQISLLATLQKLKLKQKLKYEFVQKTLLKRQIPKPKPKPPKIPFPVWLPKTGIGITAFAKKIKLKLKPAYEIQVRRWGKFLKIGEDLPLGKALKLGAKRVRETLAATFKLIPKGFTKKPDISFKPSPLIFRKPKKDITPLMFVQRRGKRLAAKTEVWEIKRARKGKRIKRMRWF